MQVQHHCELALSREKAHKESPDKLMQGVLEFRNAPGCGLKTPDNVMSACWNAPVCSR